MQVALQSIARSLIKAFIYIGIYPRRFYRAFLRLPFGRKLCAIAFLAFLLWHFIEMTTAPAQAILLNDLTAPGRTVGNLIMEFFGKKIDEIYTGKYGIIPWMATTANTIAIFPITFGVLERMEAYSHKEPGEHVIKDHLFWMLVCFGVAMAGGGIIYGQFYIVLFRTLENITQQMDDYLNIRDALDSGKAYLAVNSMISSKITTCQAMVGQEQQRCLSDATSAVLKEMGGYREAVQGQKWFQETVQSFTDIAQSLTSPDTSLTDKAQSIFYLFAAPIAEVKGAADSLNTIVTISICYGAAMVLLGFAGIWAWLASLLTPVKQSGLIAWVISVFSLWLWRVCVLILLWLSSEMMTEAASVPGDAIGNLAFAQVIQYGAIALAVACTGGGFAVFMGVQNSAERLLPGFSGGNQNTQIQQVQQAPPPPVGSSGVATDY
jgi:hypothetical protein